MLLKACCHAGVALRGLPRIYQVLARSHWDANKKTAGGASSPIQDAICLSFGAGAQRPEAFVCIAYFSRYGRRLGDLFHGLLSFFSRTRERRAGHDYCEPTRRLCQIKQDSSHDDGTLSDREMGGME